MQFQLFLYGLLPDRVWCLPAATGPPAEAHARRLRRLSNRGKFIYFNLFVYVHRILTIFSRELCAGRVPRSCVSRVTPKEDSLVFNF